MEDTHFIEIYERYKTLVFRIAFSYVKEREVAEDVMQSVFLKFYRKPPRDEENLSAYLAVVTKNLSIDFLRRKKIEKRAILGIERDASLSHSVCDEWNVLQAVNDLPEKYSSVIRLFYYGGLSVKEVAIALKVNENSVKKRLERARNKLKRMLEEELP